MSDNADNDDYDLCETRDDGSDRISYNELLSMHRTILKTNENQSETLNNISESLKTISKYMWGQQQQQQQQQPATAATTAAPASQQQQRHLPPPSQQQQQQQHLLLPSQRLSSSEGNLITEKNWPTASEALASPCHVCLYFGHYANECPNIREQYRGNCFKCWMPGHNWSGFCRVKTNPPKHNFFKNPTELLNSIIME